jgi:outer membrane translocation and assembly module TamA
VLPDANTLYGGIRAEYVFDNTTINGLNMIEGTRMKIRYENYLATNVSDQSFDNFTIDLRNYQKIHRDIIFATRLAYGLFGGRARRNYVMGGMDNWIFNQRDNQGKDDLLSNYSYLIDRRDQLFIEFVTPLRGFNYNKLFGNNFGLFNAEFRFPIVKYFYRGPITSNFFKNLQLVAFTDIGAAWTGKGPFSRQNSLNTRIEGGEGSPFRASVTNFKNPFLSGHGAGVRTLLLGYYLKFDVAWGVEDFVVAKPKYYLTFGYDF